MNPSGSLTRSISTGLGAALQLARGRPDGMQAIDADLRGAARSFWAMAICLPAFICLRLLDHRAGGSSLAAAHGFALDLLSYGIGWVGFALASRPIIATMGRAPLWPRFIVIWNWCNVVQYLLLVIASIPGLLGAPALLDQTLGLVALGWALWLEWYATRLALGITMLPAIGLVALDVAIGLVLNSITVTLGVS